MSECTLTVDVLDAALPEQTLLCTQWVSYSSIWSYYGIEPYCERFYQIFENVIRSAAKHGMNTILTPVLTPPLDTAIGGERPTVQLIDVTRKDCKYSF